MRRIAAVLTVAALVVGGTGSAVSAPAWTTTPSPNPTKLRNTLSDVVALSRNDVWAVGSSTYHLGAGGDWRYRALMLHWDGTRWSRVPVPEHEDEMGSLDSISATGRDNMWAVKNANRSDYLLRSTGGPWERVALPSVKGTFGPRGVAAVDGGAWVYGRIERGRVAKPAAMRFDGTTWQTSVLPSPKDTRASIDSIAVVPGTLKLVAVGSIYPVNMSTSRAYVAVYDGKSWTRQATPRSSSKMDLVSVVALSGRNVWAVGSQLDEQRGMHVPLVMRYRPRSGWRVVRHPVRGTGGLASIAAHGPRNIVMAGTLDVPPQWGARTLVLRFNGSKVVRQTTPNPVKTATGINNLSGVAAVPGTAQFWAVGARGPDASKWMKMRTFTIRGR
jgi:hypothetical protein